MENSKSIIKNSAFNIIYKVLNVFYPLISEAYIARVLQPEGVGKIALALTITTYFTTVAALGIPNYGVKAIGSVQSDFDKRSKVFSELIAINFISTMAVFMCYLLFVFVINKNIDERILMIFSILVIANFINIDWFYQGIEKYGYIATRSLIIKIIALVMLFLFVRKKEDVYIYAIIIVFASCGNYLLNILNIHKYIKLKLNKIEIKKHMRPIIYLLFATCATEIYTMLDSTMIGLLRSEVELAYYSNASRLVRTIFNVLTAMCAVLLPRLSLLFKENKIDEYKDLSIKGVMIALFFAIPGAIGTFVLAGRMIPLLFGTLFNPSEVALRILAVLIIVFSVAYTGGHIILISSNNENYILRATILGAIINFSLNLVSIPYLGYIGAAIASVIAETVVTIMLVYYAQKCCYNVVPLKFIIKVITTSLFMGFVVYTIQRLISNHLLAVATSVFIGVFTYLCLNMLLKNEVLLMFTKRLEKGIK